MNIWIALLLVCVSHKSLGFGDDSAFYERGTTTTINRFPHQVTIHVDDGDDSFFCGGFIISEWSIITGAHCVENVNVSAIEVLAGSTFRNCGFIIPIAELIIHPEYDSALFDNDVAVLNTKDPIYFNNVIQPIELAPLGWPIDENAFVLISGWGELAQREGEFPHRLMKVHLPVVNRQKCRDSYTRPITENQFCVGFFYLGGRDTCQGDSGGAVIQGGFAVGIVSFGLGCGKAMSPNGITYIGADSIRYFIYEHTGM